MRYLLDACTFIWLIDETEKLSPVVRDAIADAGNDLFLSAASAWEIAVKYAKGTLGLAVDPARFVPKNREAHRIDELPIRESETLAAGRLPPLHRDPFDRILVAQAIENGLTILTPDEAIRQYPARTLW